MRASVFLLGLFLWGLVPGCGSTSLTIDVDIGVNQSVNPLLQIEQDPNSGVFFIFDLLNCPPATINDTNTTTPDTFQFPPATQPGGASATQSEYKIDTSELQPNGYYRVTMAAFNAFSAQATHQGVGDCPINLALGDQSFSTICFGVNNPADPPLCPGTIPFSQCPGVSAGLCP